MNRRNPKLGEVPFIEVKIAYHWKPIHDSNGLWIGNSATQEVVPSINSFAALLELEVSCPMNRGLDIDVADVQLAATHESVALISLGKSDDLMEQSLVQKSVLSPHDLSMASYHSASEKQDVELDPMNYLDSIVDYDSNVDIANVELPLHVVKAGVKHLGMPVLTHQVQIGSFCQSVAGHHHGEDQGSCSSLGKLKRNIDVLRKQIDASRARALVGSFTLGSWKSLCGGSGSVRNHSNLPRVPVSSDCLPPNDNLSSALLTEEIPSPLPTDDLSHSSEGGGPKSSLKKFKKAQEEMFSLFYSACLESLEHTKKGILVRLIFVGSSAGLPPFVGMDIDGWQIGQHEAFC
ncbi:hypothetical protein Nepgr_028888 [Nepenthes gracilis]|uniref:Uncharacterized protein n=1 Tax=Nepenthes gracilis TaxID=150966 RepID=A0AAD3Y4C4_NEPGR|nr:hypothetical protein Nepgr_028888 [Nepenthes gracilis]